MKSGLIINTFVRVIENFLHGHSLKLTIWCQNQLGTAHKVPKLLSAIFIAKSVLLFTSRVSSVFCHGTSIEGAQQTTWLQRARSVSKPHIWSFSGSSCVCVRLSGWNIMGIRGERNTWLSCTVFFFAHAQRNATRTIDYRATYIYGIEKGCMLLVVLHWATLKYSTKYLALAKINCNVTFWSCLLSSCMSELWSYSQRKQGSVVFLRGRSSCLNFIHLSNQKPGAHSMILFVQAASSR